MATEPKKEKEAPKPPPPSASAKEVIQYAQEKYEFVVSNEGKVLARPHGSPILVEVEGLGRHLLAGMFTDKGQPVGSRQVQTALDTLIGLAMNKEQTDVYLRTAQRSASLYLDLGRPDEEIVEVSPYGWELISSRLAEAQKAQEANPRSEVERPFVPDFYRTRKIKPLPIPEQDDNARDEFADLLGFDLTDQRFHLLWGWIVASLFSGLERPALWLTGAQGSGKTTAGLLACSVVDPFSYMGGSFGKNEKDDLTVAAASYIPSWDNLTRISQSQSDLICRLITGFEFAARKLYSNSDLHLAPIRRTAMFTSINLPIGLREDALDRIVHLDMDQITMTSRKGRADIESKFEEMHPRLLGCALSDAAGVLNYWQQAREETAGSLERMADYTVLLAALDLHLGRHPRYGRFLSSFRAALAQARLERATDDGFSQAINRITGTKGAVFENMKALAESLAVAPEAPTDRMAWWPTNGRQVSDALRRHSSSLKSLGVEVHVGQRTKNGVPVELRRAEMVDLPVDKPSDDFLEMLEEDRNIFSAMVQ